MYLNYFSASVSEYYLSRHLTPQLANVPDDATLVIVTDDPGFSSNVTEMTLFIMMLSFTQGIVVPSFYFCYLLCVKCDGDFMMS
jgi:hypothetical protein